MNGVCDKFCKGCMYSSYACGEYSRLCTYYLRTGIRRPCPAGTGCTVKTLGKAKGAWRYKEETDWAEKMKKAREAKQVVRKVICKECGTEFETVSKAAMYCSRRCKNRVSQRNVYRRMQNAKQEKSVLSEARST